MTTIKVWTKGNDNGNADNVGKAYDGMFGFEMTAWGWDWFELTSNSEEAKTDAYEMEYELQDNKEIETYETYN